MTIGQVAKRMGIPASSIRFYERSGLLPEPVRSGGKRQYDATILEQLAILKFAKDCGFTLEEIRQFLNRFRDRAPLSERMPAQVRKKIAELDALADRITTMRKLLEGASSCRCKDLRECGQKILGRISSTKMIIRRHLWI